MEDPLSTRPLGDDERSQLEAGLRSSDPSVLLRSQIVLVSDEGLAPDQVGFMVGVNGEVVREAIRRFNEEGLDFVLEHADLTTEEPAPTSAKGESEQPPVISTTPTVPEAPETPVVSEIPEVPEPPAVPEQPAVPEIPEAPEPLVVSQAAPNLEEREPRPRRQTQPQPFSREGPIFVRQLKPLEGEQLKEKLGSSDEWVSHRAQIIVASSEGKTPAEISRLVGRAPQTVSEVITKFNYQGLASLERPNLGVLLRLKPASDWPIEAAEPEMAEPPETPSIPDGELGQVEPVPEPQPQVPPEPSGDERGIFVRPLTPSERTQLEELLRSSDSSVLRRCQVIMASSEGQSPEAIARLVGLSVQEVVFLIQDFNQRGLAIMDRFVLPTELEVTPAAEVPEPTPPAEEEPEAPRVPRLERVNAAFFPFNPNPPKDGLGDSP